MSRAPKYSSYYQKYGRAQAIKHGAYAQEDDIENIDPYRPVVIAAGPLAQKPEEVKPPEVESVRESGEYYAVDADTNEKSSLRHETKAIKALRSFVDRAGSINATRDVIELQVILYTLYGIRLSRSISASLKINHDSISVSLLNLMLTMGIRVNRGNSTVSFPMVGKEALAELITMTWLHIISVVPDAKPIVAEYLESASPKKRSTPKKDSLFLEQVYTTENQLEPQAGENSRSIKQKVHQEYTDPTSLPFQIMIMSFLFGGIPFSDLCLIFSLLENAENNSLNGEPIDGDSMFVIMTSISKNKNLCSTVKSATDAYLSHGHNPLVIKAVIHQIIETLRTRYIDNLESMFQVALAHQDDQLDSFLSNVLLPMFCNGNSGQTSSGASFLVGGDTASTGSFLAEEIRTRKYVVFKDNTNKSGKAAPYPALNMKGVMSAGQYESLKDIVDPYQFKVDIKPILVSMGMRVYEDDSRHLVYIVEAEGPYWVHMRGDFVRSCNDYRKENLKLMAFGNAWQRQQ